jgi:hypothetical protein
VEDSGPVEYVIDAVRRRPERMRVGVQDVYPVGAVAEILDIGSDLA